MLVLAVNLCEQPTFVPCDVCSRYIHCGDMRFHAAYYKDPLVQQFKGADAVFLDTTYCKERYTFPTQVCAMMLRSPDLGCLCGQAQTMDHAH